MCEGSGKIQRFFFLFAIKNAVVLACCKTAMKSQVLHKGRARAETEKGEREGRQLAMQAIKELFSN